jgi:predicted RNA-binding Zn-ribbon protein involved in translation (DUF1610 family)
MTGIGQVIIGILFLVVYFLPSIVAYVDKKKSLGGIVLLNLFLGWTILGWIGAIIWAVSSKRQEPEFIYTCSKCGYKSNLNQKVKLFVCPQCKYETQYN